MHIYRSRAENKFQTPYSAWHALELFLFTGSWVGSKKSVFFGTSLPDPDPSVKGG